MPKTTVRKELPNCYWYHSSCPYENSKAKCTKKGNCGFKETQRAMKERLAKNDR